MPAEKGLVERADVAHYVEAGRPGLDQEHRRAAAGVWVVRGAGHHDAEGRTVRPGDVPLVPVDDPAPNRALGMGS